MIAAKALQSYLWTITKRSLVSRCSTLDSERIQSICANDEDRMMEVKWKDGRTGRYPYVWLRDMSSDPDTFTITPAVKARNLTMQYFDINVKPEEHQIYEDAMQINWSDGTMSRYRSCWLRLRNISSVETIELRKQIYFDIVRLWNTKQITERVKRYCHTDIISDDQSLHDFLVSVCEDGIAVITDGARENAIQEISERIGLIHRTHFGEIFEVTTKADAGNLAYASSSELGLHTDLTSMTSPPEIQMLHVEQRAKFGGHSLFVDGFYVAEQMRNDYPELFDVLRRVKIEHIEEGSDIHEMPTGGSRKEQFDMAARHKIICTDCNARTKKVHFSNAMRSWFYGCDVEEICTVYKAMKKFMDLCYRPENLFSVMLENGETVLWANTRLLHGRTSFESFAGQPRSLTGCYFSWDTIKSKIRLLRDRLNHPLNQPSI